MRRFILLELVMAMVIFSGCSRLFEWVSVRDGVEFYGESIVRVEGVEIRVRDFGVVNSWGNPQVQLRVYNRGSKPVVFKPLECNIDIEGKIVRPETSGVNAHKRYAPMELRPGENARVTISFDGHLRQEVMENSPEKNRIKPEVLHLQLAPVSINGVSHPSPILTYRNPHP